MSRIVMTTIGSLGDLHPFVAISLELRERGHQVAIATTEVYRDKIGGLGIPFYPLSPHIKIGDAEMISRIVDGRNGPEYLMRKVIFPSIRATYDDLTFAVKADGGADAIIAGELVYPAPLVSEKLGMPWISCTLAPMSLLSSRDLPVLPGTERMSWLVKGGPALSGLIIAAGRFLTRNWSRPLADLRKELGLAAAANPFFEGKYSPFLALALFSRMFASPQADWPSNMVVTGFPFYDAESEGLKIAPELEAFLQAGPPPVVFTLGSAAVFLPGRFYEESVEAARRAGLRAVLLIGKNSPPPDLPDFAIASEYAPYSAIFPRAAASVHSGGIGTTSQALRSGRPMLVMPYSFDQFDNAARAVRLGAGRTLFRRNYNAVAAARALRELLDNPNYGAAAKKAGDCLKSERGVANACDRIESLLARKSPTTQ